jgi:Tfp pilus assembly protein FimT
MVRYKNQQGVSLIEVLVVAAITMFLIAIGGPSVVESLNRAQVKSVSQETYFLFKQARSQALASSVDISLDFETGSNWCIGMSDSGLCDCTTLNSCSVNGLESVISQDDFDVTSMDSAMFGNDTEVVFDGQRGLALNDAGAVEFSDEQNNQIRVSLNILGRTDICVVSGQIGNYPSC